MKILEVTPNFDPSVGGQERHVSALSKHLANLGHDVTVLTCGPYPQSIVQGFKVFRIDSSSLIGLHILPLRKLVTFLAENRFEICHLHHETLFGETVLLANRILKLPLVTTLHTSMTRSLPAKFILDSVSLRFVSASSSKVICLSSSIMQNLAKRGLDRSKCVVIPNALDVETIEEQFRQIRNAPSENETEFDVLFVGRLEQRKGLRWLIDSISLLHKKGKKYTLRIVGHGPMIRDVRKKVSADNLDRYVSILGYVSQEELLRSYLLAKVVVIPSLFEGVPTVALETMTARKPLVITDIPGLTELVISGRNGLKVPPKDARSLASAIEKIIDSRIICIYWRKLINEFSPFFLGKQLLTT